MVLLGETDRRPGAFARARVGGHDQDHVTEIGLTAIRVRQGAVIHDLQQHIENIRVGLLDFVQQQHGVRMARDRLGQQTALVMAHVSGGRTDQPRYGV